MSERREVHEVDVRASLDDVWAMLTTDRGLAAWFGVGAEVDPVVGGAFRVWWDDDGVAIDATVAEVDPGRRLVVVYGDDDPSGAEEWLLEHVDGVTRVRVVHTLEDPGVDDWEGFYGDFRRGWALFLASLRWALEDAPTPSRTAQARAVPVADRRTAWAEVTEALGLAVRPSVGDVVAGVGTVVLVDAPHSLLVAGDDVTLLCDHEGDGDRLVRMEQVAIHGPDDAARRRGLLDRLPAA